MGRTRIRWSNVGRLVGGLGAGGLLLVVLPGILEPSEPPPLPADVGLSSGATGAYEPVAPDPVPDRRQPSHPGPRPERRPPPSVPQHPDRSHGRPRDEGQQAQAPAPSSPPPPVEHAATPPPAAVAPAPVSSPPPPAPEPAPPEAPEQAPPQQPPPPEPTPSPSPSPSQFGFEH